MAEKIAIRDAYGEALLKLGKKNDKIVALDADVGGSTKSALFGKEFPERYYNVGISELNMVAMSAGLASEGMIPFVNTFAVFLATRGGDPIQSLIAYDKLNVKLCGTYTGMSDSYDGASHHAITDMAFVRAIPNMTVITVADAVETAKAVEAVAKYEGPVYLRLSRAAVPVVYDENMKFEIGKGIKLKEGKDLTIVTTGTILSKAVEAAEILEKEGIHVTLVDMHTVKPIDEELIEECAKETGAFVTVEEHSLQGGLYSAVCEVLAKTCSTIVEGIGATDFAESGDYEQLLEKYGYGAEAIAEKCRVVLKKKAGK
ncbi:transketolase family protein [Dorea sp. OM02-2LB]|nr:transketolase family protein [Dorea sp. OM02-2LB]